METRSYDTVSHAQSADFLSECCPPLLTGFFCMPREVKLYVRSLDSLGAANFILELIDRTYGGRFDDSYGPLAAELGKDESSHPRWAAFTISEIAKITRTKETGAKKVVRS